ncbi:fibroblast growth factor-binding protein 2b [Betta splendens]|uniref:Fibroblast growth factor-binding protein 2b n=1 Tax=Betta splendens TaxID=158456 RepID=A0A6P7M987_BETSP|nr:fibroblast growth factor-binding protein 2b [Betta splendens]
MVPGMRALLLFLAVTVYASSAQTDNKQPPPPHGGNWDEPIKFSTKTKDSCAMVTSALGNYTRLRVSCKGQSQGQTPGRSYYCDFQGKPNLCRAYGANPRHYFTQMMWELRKLGHACQGAKLYRPPMCKKYPDEAQMTFLASWPKTAVPRPPKPGPDRQAAPTQSKPAATVRPNRPAKPQPGKNRKSTVRPLKPAAPPTEQPDAAAQRLASEYCWKSLHGICAYVISWFQE